MDAGRVGGMPSPVTPSLGFCKGTRAVARTSLWAGIPEVQLTFSWLRQHAAAQFFFAQMELGIRFGVVRDAEVQLGGLEDALCDVSIHRNTCLLICLCCPLCAKLAD